MATLTDLPPTVRVAVAFPTLLFFTSASAVHVRTSTELHRSIGAAPQHDPELSMIGMAAIRRAEMMKPYAGEIDVWEEGSEVGNVGNNRHHKSLSLMA